MITSLPVPTNHAHGTRARYVGARCRCADCRAANTAYAASRAAQAKTEAASIVGTATVTKPHGEIVRSYRRACIGVGGPCPMRSYLRKDSTGDVCAQCRSRVIWNGLVSAEPARVHMATLSKRGIGYKSIADAASVARSIIAGIARGERSQVRAQALARILAVDEQAAADGARINGAETWRLLRELITAGYRKSRIAELLGARAKHPALQIQRGRVLATTARKVKLLHVELLAEGPDLDPINGTPRVRITAALRWFDWIASEDLFDVMAVAADDRDRYVQAISRLARSGAVQRRRVDGEYEYALHNKCPRKDP